MQACEFLGHPCCGPFGGRLRCLLGDCILLASSASSAPRSSLTPAVSESRSCGRSRYGEHCVVVGGGQGQFPLPAQAPSLDASLCATGFILASILSYLSFFGLPLFLRPPVQVCSRCPGALPSQSLGCRVYRHLGARSGPRTTVSHLAR